MRMYNYEIEGFVDFLMRLELLGRESRMRTRFCKLAAQRLQEIEEERMLLIKDFSNLDENGEPVVVGNQYDINDLEGFTREYRILQTEEFVIEQTPDKLDMINSLRSAVLNAEIKFSGEDAILYDRFCDIVEGE